MALLSSPTIKHAAHIANVGEATIFRWLKLPEFETAYREARKEVLNQATARLQNITSEAVDTLQKLMNDDETPPVNRISAAKIILDLSYKSFEIDELTNRLIRLENEVKKGG